MFKISACGVIIVVLTLSLAGCVNNNEDNESESAGFPRVVAGNHDPIRGGMEPGAGGVASVRIGSVCRVGDQPIELTEVTVDDVEGDIALTDFSVYADPPGGRLGSGAQPFPIREVSGYRGGDVVSALCKSDSDVSGESLAVELTLSSGPLGVAKGFTLSWESEGGTYTVKIPWTQELCVRYRDCH